MLNTLQAAYKTPLMAALILVLTLLQGSSFMLTMALRSPFASVFAVSMITVAWLLMYLIATVGLITSSGLNWGTWMVRYRLPLTIIVAGTCFSALWSMDTILTVERSVHLLGTTLLAVYLGFSLPLTKILRISATVLGLLMVASIIAAVVFPSVGQVEYEKTFVWAGVLTSKNTLGFWSVISILLLSSICFWQISPVARTFYLVLAIASAVCLYFSESATSLLALISAACVMIYLHIAFSLRLGLISMMVLGVLVTGLAGVAFHFIDTAELIGRSGDLTGRGDVWAQTWQLILNRPWTGYGYGTIWFPTDSSIWIQKTLTDFTWTVHHAHNGFLQVASEIGLPLAALTMVMVIQQVIEIIYCQYQRQQPGLLFVLGFMVALLLSNYSEARLLINRDLHWIFFIALPISMLQQITLRQSHSGVSGVPAALRPYKREKLKVARECLQHRHFLKKRLSKRREITAVNAHEFNKTQSVSPKNKAEATPIRAGITINGRLDQKNGQAVIRRKMARRHRKAG
ncbi:MAG: exopolysaccharide production protein ExoQ [Granulosicoccus sp.]|jgi:O-antigen ligase